MSAFDLIDYIPGPSGRSVIARAFRQMAIAEEALASAEPELRAAGVTDAFLVLRPSPLVSDLGEEVYRGHCRELVSRMLGVVRAGYRSARLGAHAEVAAPTAAEFAAVLALVSLRAPITAQATRAYERAFRVVFGDDVADRLGIERAEVRPEDEEFVIELRRATARHVPSGGRS